MDSMMLTELAGLVLLGSWSLALPAATLTVIALVVFGRKKPMRKRTASLIAGGFSLFVGTGVMLALWGLRGEFADPLMLVAIIPGAAIVALLGALPAALLARWLLKNHIAAREATEGFEAA